MRLIYPVVVSLSLLVSLPSGADTDQYSPVVGRDYPTQVYWGDTHVHSRNSPDAYFLANTRLTVEDAYRFASGEQVMLREGVPVQLKRPLDFLVVADHAEFMGIFPLLDNEDTDFLKTELGQHWNNNIKAGKRGIVLSEFISALRGDEWEYSVPLSTQQSVWKKTVELADRYNDPGKFTVFSGYEWTSMPDGNNLHRVVIFKDGADKVTRVVPWSGIDSGDPQTLWQYLQDYVKLTGGDALAIPHNPNASNGLMFAPQTLSGQALTAAYAKTRARWEPLLEVTQFKGDSETHPLLSPDDEFADYETWDQGNIDNSARKQRWMLKHEYARAALKQGLQLQQQVGANPFKFGMIGSTDTHTSLAAAGEDNFFGKFPGEAPRPGRALDALVTNGRTFYSNWRLAASGYAAIWAQQNTRESLFAAMKRREVYATTGPRITVRLFAGWSFVAGDEHRPDFVDYGYRHGVPMGGDLTGAPEKTPPSILVFAAKDPDGANLDRIQVVKGGLTKTGASYEKVYSVALADNRVANLQTGEIPPVGNTVVNASYRNSIGDAQLSAVWTDPDFDASQPAFYYVRVLQIPTPRWTAYDAAFYDIEMPAQVPMQHQERAYSSPIWYTP